jgi:hypothetical protein
MCKINKYDNYNKTNRVLIGVIVQKKIMHHLRIEIEMGWSTNFSFENSFEDIGILQGAEFKTNGVSLKINVHLI